MTAETKTAAEIMSAAQTDAFHLQGILQGADMIMEGIDGDDRKRARGALFSLIREAEMMAAKLGCDLDSLNLREGAE